MKAIILAAGKGTRMRPLTYTCPKPLLNINGKPILDYIIYSLPKEISEIILVTGYLEEAIKANCGSNYLGKKIKYVSQRELNGTFVALSLCRDYINKGERFFIFYADEIHGSAGLSEMLKFPQSLSYTLVDNPSSYGVIEYDDNMKITSIIEKPDNPATNTVSSGALLVDDDIFSYTSDKGPKGEYYITSAIEKMLIDNPIYAVKSSSWLPVGNIDELKKADELIKKGEIKI